jgi:hypothetical protein
VNDRETETVSLGTAAKRDRDKTQLIKTARLRPHRVHKNASVQEHSVLLRRLSISQSRRRKWDVVFEVKFLKYTLFVLILLPHRKLASRCP